MICVENNQRIFLMKKIFVKDSKPGMQTSPWIILGATLILLIVVLVLAIGNTQREKRYITEILSIKGAALIRAVEVGTRTGMMRWQWRGDHVQRILEETARLQDVHYMSLVDENGIVVAHSDPTRIGTVFRSNDKLVHVGPGQKENWEIVTLEDGQRVFEVHRRFQPQFRHEGGFREHPGMMMRHHGMGMAPRADDEDWLRSDKIKHLLIVVGMDVAPFQEAIAAEIRTTIVMSVVLLLLGFSGLVSLFWMYHYRATKKSLQDTSAFADEVVTHLPVGLVATDHNGNIAFFNAAAEKITGKKGANVKGHPTEKIMPTELCGLKKHLDQGNSIIEKEIECLFASDRKVPVSVSATRIINEVGDFVGNILILRDLGEVRHLQEEVRRQEKLAALGGLAAGVAHEIRNPLSSIKGMATYLAGLFERESEPWQAASIMVQEVERLNRVITELLEFARPTSLTYRNTDLEPLLRRSLQLIQQDAEAHDITVALEVSPNICSVLIDPDRISQCLLNLYLNAIESMDKGGRLSVTAHMDHADQNVRIQVHDTGSGIAPQNLNKIFDPYFTTKKSGTGLGLAIVHKIITAHQGRLKAVSTKETGTTFIFWVPCQESI
jgi:two-component system, NtrC family, sensor histidine kinase HydH